MACHRTQPPAAPVPQGSGAAGIYGTYPPALRLGAYEVLSPRALASSIVYKELSKRLGI